MRSTKPFSSSDDVALKIYGERNTGTNYLAALADLNLQAQVLPGRVDDGDLRTIFTRRLRRFMPGLTHRLHETARDRFFEATFARNLGWKHMNPDPERIGPEALASVRFLMLVKNPYAWLLSLFQRPYHVGAQDSDLERFLTRRLPVMEQRENLGPRPLLPAEVWNRKMRGYARLQQAATHAVIARYEDFLADEAATLARVAADLGIAKRDRHVPVSEGVKREDGTVSHRTYADYYLRECWREKLGPATLDIINETLDPEIVSLMGYEMITPDMLSGAT